MSSFSHHPIHLLDPWNQKLTYPNYSTKIVLLKMPVIFYYPTGNLSSTPVLTFSAAVEVSPSLISRTFCWDCLNCLLCVLCAIAGPFLFFKAMFVPASGALFLPPSSLEGSASDCHLVIFLPYMSLLNVSFSVGLFIKTLSGTSLL